MVQARGGASRVVRSIEGWVLLRGHQWVLCHGHGHQLKRQAKELLRRARAGDEGAAAQISSVSPAVNFASAQLVIARSDGFGNWAQLKAEAERKEAEKAEAGWHSLAVFESWFDEESQTDRETEYHEGSCRQCGANYAFETSIVRGFADFVEAKCPKCGASLGTFREDVCQRRSNPEQESPAET